MGIDKAISPSDGERGKPGRPLHPIDAKQVEELAKIHCTNAEIAAVLGCAESTLTERFSEDLEKWRAVGKKSLRRLQWDLAETGNPTMLIWLGKNQLGQTDKTDLTSDGKAITFRYADGVDPRAI